MFSFLIMTFCCFVGIYAMFQEDINEILTRAEHLCPVTLQFVIITQFVINYKLRWIAKQFVIHYKLRSEF